METLILLNTRATVTIKNISSEKMCISIIFKGVDVLLLEVSDVELSVYNVYSAVTCTVTEWMITHLNADYLIVLLYISMPPYTGQH